MTHLVVVGGSDAGISAALRARELSPEIDVSVVVADDYPNFSICGIPYLVSGEVLEWQNLAHRTVSDLEATGMQLVLNTRATRVEAAEHRLHLTLPSGLEQTISYDDLIIGTGAVPVRPPIPGLTGPDGLGAPDGVHVLHSMSDTFAVIAALNERHPRHAVIVGAGYIGLEMAEALTLRGIHVTQMEGLPQVLPTVDPELGGLLKAELEAHGVEVLTSTKVTEVTQSPQGDGLRVNAMRDGSDPVQRDADLVLVVVGVRPDTDLALSAGATLAEKGAICVDEQMRTGVPNVYAAGDCVRTHHRLLGSTWMPLGTTAHKQGRVAGENAVGGSRQFAGCLGTQVVKVFDAVAARTGLRDHEAVEAPGGWRPATVASTVDDHKAYYPGATPLTIRVTGDTNTGRLLGAQMIGRLGAEVSKRIDIYATALFHNMTIDGLNDLDLSYTPPLGSPWDAVQLAAAAWLREHPAAPLDV